ncbi:hypothetical protein CRG98_030148 [Punica granatum]|uniref:Uncharacterized protein n=1 Tax=Punica granatum TaxID=22663 RepID=A0A2I0J171_PUNGR|nr:hypothetical protein CRG98_030148 [Punica granatum]
MRDTEKALNFGCSKIWFASDALLISNKGNRKGIGVGAANWRPRWSGRGCRLAAPTTNRSGSFELESQVHSRSGPPIGDPDTSTEVVGAHRGHRRPRWRGRGSRLGAPIPIPFRFPLLD